MTSITAVLVEYVWKQRNLSTIEDSNIFHRGDGPCGTKASSLVTIEVLVPNSIVCNYYSSVFYDDSSSEDCTSVVVYFYDSWSGWANQIESGGKITLKGVVLTSNDYGDSEEGQMCIVVAEQRLLNQFPTTLHGNVGVTTVKYFPTDGFMREMTSDKLSTYTPVAAPDRNIRRKLNNIRGEYKYTNLSDPLNDLGANVYGLVLSASLPQSKDDDGDSSEDYWIRILITDPSLVEKPGRQVMVVTIYATSKAQLPALVYTGDVIRLHKLKITRSGDKVSGIGSARAVEHLVLRLSHSKVNIVSSSSTKKTAHTFSTKDHQLALKLLQWGKNCISSPSLYAFGQISSEKDDDGSTLDINSLVQCIESNQSTNKSYYDIVVHYNKTTGFSCRPNVIKFKLYEKFTLELTFHKAEDKTTLLHGSLKDTPCWVKFQSIALYYQKSTNKLTGYYNDYSSVLLLPLYAHEITLWKTEGKGSHRDGLTEFCKTILKVESEVATLPVQTLSNVKSTLTENVFHALVKVVGMYVPTQQKAMMMVLRVVDDTSSLDLILYEKEGDNTVAAFSEKLISQKTQHHIGIKAFIPASSSSSLSLHYKVHCTSVCTL